MAIALIPTWLQEYEEEQSLMAEVLFRCNQCKDSKLYTSIEAGKHKEKMGHYSFRMIKWGSKQ